MNITNLVSSPRNLFSVMIQEMTRSNNVISKVISKVLIKSSKTRSYYLSNVRFSRVPIIFSTLSFEAKGAFGPPISRKQRNRNFSYYILTFLFLNFRKDITSSDPSRVHANDRDVEWFEVATQRSGDHIQRGLICKNEKTFS